VETLWTVLILVTLRTRVGTTVFFAGIAALTVVIGKAIPMRRLSSACCRHGTDQGRGQPHGLLQYDQRIIGYYLAIAIDVATFGTRDARSSGEDNAERSGEQYLRDPSSLHRVRVLVLLE
jgi:hypothetical protein